MKIHETVIQGSQEWLDLRAGKITASEAEAILTPKFAPKESKAVDTYLGRKWAEKWQHAPIMDEDFYSAPVEWGKILETEAKPTFKLLKDIDLKNVGFIESDDGLCGCSPDGLTSDGGGLEIKSPLIQTHCRYLAAGVVPPDYIIQVNFSLFITGFSHWYFMSYRRLMPPLILRVERDEKIMSAIADAVDIFKAKLDAGWAKIIELNGGKEPVKPLTVDEAMAGEPYAAGIDHLAGA